MKIIQYFNVPWEELDKTDLEIEIRCEKALIVLLKRELSSLYKARENKKPSRIREDKIEFFEQYIKVLDGAIGEMQEKFDKMQDVNYNPKGRLKKLQEKQNFTRHWNSIAVARTKSDESIDGIKPSWDRDKFMLVARDRGYLTEQSVIHAVSEELLVSRDMARVLLDKGKFTWGQVMCLGAMLQMTPKEFCDIFLSGYFTEYYGRYIASYDNLDREVLLKRATALTKKEIATLDQMVENLSDDEV